MHRYRWVGFEARRLEFWGALCYLVGVALFFVGLVALIINDCPGHLLPTLTYVRPPASRSLASLNSHIQL
jgi:hypothetical protein